MFIKYVPTTNDIYSDPQWLGLMSSSISKFYFKNKKGQLDMCYKTIYFVLL